LKILIEPVGRKVPSGKLEKTQVLRTPYMGGF